MLRLLLLTIFPLVILLIIEILIFIYNIYLFILNLSIDSNEKIIFDTEKFKNYSLEDKYITIAAFNYLCFGSFVTFILKQLLDFHKNFTQRTGKDELYYNGTKLDYMVDGLGECNNKNELGFELIYGFNEGNEQNIEIIH